ncbi:SDR family oxidoreductase [Empedobacter sp. UBA7248]|uniref:SDR family oxidoreductase n=1 Tax=Empedobacter sp. UBA7248 TaxID=1946448 RepID=UPI0025C480F7|nr:SDR family oxidoreductase [Empedobacter sp. UBA7248]
MKLKNKKVLITGGTSGIGLATVKLFLQEGAQVIIAGRNGEHLRQDLVDFDKTNWHFFSYDTSKINEIDRLITFIQKEFTQLDVAFLNAGIAKFAAIEDITEELFDEVIQTNLKGLFFTLQKISPLLNNPASVILTSSSGTHKAHIGSSVYSASKAAVRNIASTLSSEWVARGIRVNVISPGSTDTALLGKLGVDGEQLEQLKDNLVAHIPHGRLIKSEEIAQAVLYLAAPGSESQIGTEIIVDGGAFLKV